MALILHESRGIDIYVERLQPFFKNQIFLYTYHSLFDISKIVNDIGSQGFKILVGGPTALHYGNMLGINSFILRLGQYNHDLCRKYRNVRESI